ncbi:hypothetical protein BAE44_0010786 [Dichanthelium oligosanthes]|uniref:F-box domain-containing protein n=1 Tax=Dichanthelium oligosanthes TaxID=888268 RepID=A0A1E5VSU8_9POAL|nr:hypothetical protein BAE44_0010786 [Dichanthelium oligosanthes]
MDSSESESIEVAVARLPDDALMEILSRLNAKSLCRSKCVSKPWRDLIADGLRCKNLPQTLQGFLYFNGGNGDGNSEGNDNGNLVSSRTKRLPRPNYGHFINLLGESVPLLDSSFTFMKEQLEAEAIKLLDSCNGLLLFGQRGGSDTFDSWGYIVCNPVTEQWVAVPSSGLTPPPPEEGEEDSENDVHTFLLFDPSVSPYFRLVQFWQDGYRENVEGVRTYSSESGLWSDRSNEWHEGAGRWSYRWSYYGAIGSSSLNGSVFVNGMLHFLFYRFASEEFEIVAVDVQGKTCNVICWPNKHLHDNAAFIGKSQGHLHCISGLGKPGISIWVLQDYDAEEWVLKHSVSFLQLFGRKSFVSFIRYYVVALHPDRNLVFLIDQRDRKLISYDLDSREVCVLHTLRQGYSRMTLYVPCFDSSVLAYKH